MSLFGSVCDDFGMTVYLASKAELPTAREPVLHFFEAVRRRFPHLTDFDRRDGGEYVLEQDRDGGAYSWVGLDVRRLALGWVNPAEPSAADEQAEWLLDAAPFHLSLTGLDAEYLDLVYYFDLSYAGNHDEVVADALAAGGPFEPLLKLEGARPLQFQPSLTVALDPGCQLQARVSLDTRTTAFQVRTGQFGEAPLSVYFTVRQFWGRQPWGAFVDSYRNQRKVIDELAAAYVVPNVVQPLARAIAARQ